MKTKKSRKRLKTLADVRRYLSCLINDYRCDKIKGEKASKLGYLLNILKGVISDSDLESRIVALEKESEVKANEFKK